MAKDKLATITDAEWGVMRVIWTQGKTTSREVHTLLNEKRMEINDRQDVTKSFNR